jgi:hypothetical protein
MARWQKAARELGAACHLGVDQRLAIDRVGERGAHARIRQRGRF